MQRPIPTSTFVALRYFNVAGTAADGSLGEDHDPETHLIPVLLLTALGKQERVTVSAPITHARRHLHPRLHSRRGPLRGPYRGDERLRPGDARFYNLGIGRGYSVREVIESARRVTGKAIPVEHGPRRAGDPAALFANAEKIRASLDGRRATRTSTASWPPHGGGREASGRPLKPPDPLARS